MSVINITKTNFDTEVLVRFQAGAAGFLGHSGAACRMFSPVVDEIAEQYTGSVKVGKVNIDEEPELAQRFGVMSIPTLVLIKDGQPVQTAVGVQPKAAVEEMLK